MDMVMLEKNARLIVEGFSSNDTGMTLATGRSPLRLCQAVAVVTNPLQHCRETPTLRTVRIKNALRNARVALAP